MKGLLLLVALLGPIQALDQGTRDLIQAQRRPGLEPPMRTISDIGRPLTVISLLFGIAIGDLAQGPATARVAVLALVGTNVVVEVTKRAVNRTRPDGEHKRSNASFPSSHAANAATVAFVLARRWRRLAPLFWLGASTVALSRMYLDRHYLSDVVVGIGVGIGCGWGAYRAAEAWGTRHSRRSTPQASSRDWPEGPRL